MTSKYLQSHPREQFHIDDDETAKLLLFDLGILNDFKENPLPTATTQSILSMTAHPTHYILSILYQGRTKPGDNGFIVWCEPKCNMDASRFQTLAREILGEIGWFFSR
jgi:hypothetical protein